MTDEGLHAPCLTCIVKLVHGPVFYVCGAMGRWHVHIIILYCYYCEEPPISICENSGVRGYVCTRSRARGDASEMASAASHCEHYIVRKQRYCSSIVVQAGERFCSQHNPEALVEARARSAAAAAAAAAAGGAGSGSGSGAAAVVAISNMNDGASRKRYRRLESQHLASRSHPADDMVLEPWAWCDASLPVHIDIGCARGRWLLGLTSSGGVGRLANHVGVEIRADLVEKANAQAEQIGVAGALRYVALDARVESRCRDVSLFRSLAPRLAACSVLFPDPYKPGDTRGRTLTPSLAAAIATHLRPGGVLFVASDKPHVVLDMTCVIEATTSGVGSSGGDRRGDSGDGIGTIHDDDGGDERQANFQVGGESEQFDDSGGSIGGGGSSRGGCGRDRSGDGNSKTRSCFARITSDAAALEALTRALSGDARGIPTQGHTLPPTHSDDSHPWLGRNVWGRTTEREAYCEQPDRHGELRTVRRALYVRLDTPPPSMISPPSALPTTERQGSDG